MKVSVALTLALAIYFASANARPQTSKSLPYQERDWLVDPVHAVASIKTNCWFDDSVCGLELTNELITRRFALTNDKVFGTVDFLINATKSRGDFNRCFVLLSQKLASK